MDPIFKRFKAVFHSIKGLQGGMIRWIRRVLRHETMLKMCFGRLEMQNMSLTNFPLLYIRVCAARGTPMKSDIRTVGIFVVFDCIHSIEVC
jgi:hypothetical protein